MNKPQLNDRFKTAASGIAAIGMLALLLWAVVGGMTAVEPDDNDGGVPASVATVVEER